MSTLGYLENVTLSEQEEPKKMGSSMGHSSDGLCKYRKRLQKYEFGYCISSKSNSLTVEFTVQLCKLSQGLLTWNLLQLDSSLKTFEIPELI